MKASLLLRLAASILAASAETPNPYAAASPLEERGKPGSDVELCKTCGPKSVLTCCQATFAGDIPTVQFLANLTKYKLEPRDVNCLGVRMDSFSDPSKCVGVKTCCDVLVPSVFPQGLGQPEVGPVAGLVSLYLLGVGLYCQGINQTCSTQYGECGTHY